LGDHGVNGRVVLRGFIQKFPDRVDNEIIRNNTHTLRSNTKGYGDKTHYTDSKNSDTTASSGRELYHLQFSLEAASPESFGYAIVKHVTETRCEGFKWIQLAHDRVW
jgi:hypothetical protein